MSQSVSFEQLFEHILGVHTARAPGQRVLVALAGAPGSGKSTLAKKLVDALNTAAQTNSDSESDSPAVNEFAVVMPMDGFHLDNRVLESRQQLSRKGAAHTFDIAGFSALLSRLAQPILTSPDNKSESGSCVDAVDGAIDDALYIPLFDRELDVSRNAAQMVTSKHSLLIVEGNYLLLRQPGWQDLKSLFDVTVMLKVPLAELENRLVQRWCDHGLSESAARHRALDNDIPNARTVSSESVAAELEYHSV